MPPFTLVIDSVGGPLLNALIAPGEAQRAALAAAGKPLPDSFAIRGLIDTRASCTCVDPMVFGKQGINPTGRFPFIPRRLQVCPSNSTSSMLRS